jgi:hypothetical protein
MATTSGIHCMPDIEDNSKSSNASLSRSLDPRLDVADRKTSHLWTVAARHRKPVSCKSPPRPILSKALKLRTDIRRSGLFNGHFITGKSSKYQGSARVTSAANQVQEYLEITQPPALSPSKSTADCDVCQLRGFANLRQHEFGSWRQFETLKTSAMDGCRYCDTVVDAIETWFIRKTPDIEASMDVALKTVTSSSVLDGSFILSLRMILRWETSNEDSDVRRIFVYRPWGTYSNWAFCIYLTLLMGLSRLHRSSFGSRSKLYLS